MPTTFSVSSAALRLCAPHVATDPRRPFLCGLFLEAGGVMVATDGHTLGAIDLAHDAPGSFLLAGPWAKLAKDKGRFSSDLDILKESNGVGFVAVTVGEDKRFTAVNVTTGAAITGDALEASSYPASWRQVLPGEPDEEGWPLFRVQALDPLKLARFAPPTRKGMPSPVTLRLGKGPERAIRVVRDDAPRFVGVLMPCRDNSEYPRAARWHSAPLPCTQETPTNA